MRREKKKRDYRNDIDDRFRPRKKRKQVYRHQRMQTPSRGGVNVDAMRRIQERERGRRQQYYQRSGDRRRRSEWEDDDRRQNNNYRRRDPTPQRRKGGDPGWKRRPTDIHRPSYWNDDDANYEVDRGWYGKDEAGFVLDMTNQNPFLGDEKKFQAKERNYKKKHTKKVGAEKSEFIKDNLRWERNRVASSGLSKQNRPEFLGPQIEEEEEEEDKLYVIVHEITPPFLDGRIKFTLQEKPVLPVVDISCDLAVCARKGSEVVQQVRMRKDRERSIRDRLTIAGSSLGNILDVKVIKEDSSSLRREKKYREIIKKEGKSWGGVTTFSRTDLSSQRKNLPIYSSRQELINLLRESNVVIVVGETGSGKTTQLTQFFDEAGFSKLGRIGCTQPRRVAAMSVAKRVAEEKGCRLGGRVGYSIRFEDCTSDETVIKYMTDGVLLRETLRSPDLEKYSVIIMDEAHERSLNTDILFGILKRVVGRRRDLRLVVTSATMDSAKFSSFFGNCPVYNIPGRTFPVKIQFTRTIVMDYVDAAVKQALTIHHTTDVDGGDILIFMTGQEDITSTCDLLTDKLKELKMEKSMDVLPIYSLLPSELQARIFMKSAKGTRKCIVATNIAETSLTVDGIFFVIDCGFCKFKVYNPRVGMDVLQRYPESRAGAKQRAGRAGRTGPGLCYRLFTQKQYESEMLEATVPEIQRTNLSNVVLLLKNLGVRNLLDFDFMDPPPEDNMKKSMFQLYILGALDSSGSITVLGKKMVEFPLDPILSKMILVGSKYGCTNEILTIVSMLSVPNIFYRPDNQREESDARREKFEVPESDHLTFLNIYNQWRRKEYRSGWCKDNFIHYKALRKVREIRAQLLDIMQKNGIGLSSCGLGRLDLVRKCICAGYLHHVARLKGIGEYVNMITGLSCSLHPSSSLFGIGYTPDHVVYHELVMTSKEYMRTVTAIDPRWLEELCPTFYSIKRSDRTRGIRKKERKEWLKEMEENMKKTKFKNRGMFDRTVMPPPRMKKGGKGSRVLAPGNPKGGIRRMKTPRQI